MKQIKTFSDSRLDSHCAYCGSYPETRDHVPSKIILESPFPDNLPVVPSCQECNEGFSLDEEYFACLIECTICGTTDSENLNRDRIAKILNRKPKLKSRLNKAMVHENNRTYFKIEKKRVENVLSKLAFGHAKFENSETLLKKPSSISYMPYELLSDEEKAEFLTVDRLEIAPEVGSRAMLNTHFNNRVPISNWITVQHGIYEYLVIIGLSNLRVKIIIWDYLACEIIWN